MRTTGLNLDSDLLTHITVSFPAHQLQGIIGFAEVVMETLNMFSLPLLLLASVHNKANSKEV